VKQNEEKLKEPQAKKNSLSNSMQKLQLDQEKEKVVEVHPRKSIEKIKT